MARILNTNRYPYDEKVTKQDYVIGTDKETGLSTKNYLIGDIAQIAVGEIKLELGDKIFNGGYIHIQGYEYFLWANEYTYNDVYYNEYVSGNVTLDPADPTNDRIDLLTIVISENPLIDNTIGKVTGTPSANPIKPDPLDGHLEVVPIIVRAGTVEDPAPVKTIVYDENLQETGGEYDTNTDAPLEVDFANTVQVYSGAVSTRFNIAQQVQAVFTSTTPIKGNELSNINFKIYLGTDEILYPNVEHELQIELWDTNTNEQVGIVNVEEGKFNFSSGLLYQWQTIVIDSLSFRQDTKNWSSLEFNQIKIKNKANDALFWIDVIEIQEGLPLLDEPAERVTRTSQLINDGEGTLPFITEADIPDQNFLQLTDTPTDYVGHTGKSVRVNGTEDGLEFYLPQDIDTYVNDTNFNTATGELTLTRTQGQPDLIQNLDGRYAVGTDVDLQFVTDNGNISTNPIETTAYVKTGGTIGQILIADGSVRELSTLTLQYITDFGNVTTNNIESSPAPTLGEHLTNKTYVDTEISNAIGNVTLQTVTDNGNVTTLNIESNPVPTIGDHLTNKTYVDTQISDIEIYDGVEDLQATILALDPTTYLGQTWWARDTKSAWKAVTVLGTDVWQDVTVKYDESNDTFYFPPTQDGQVQNVGQEMFFNAVNNEVLGTTQASEPKVFLAGTAIVGDEDFVDAIKVTANDIIDGSKIGLNTTNAAPTDKFKAITYGRLNGVNTSAWLVDTILFVHPIVAGDMTDIRPEKNAFPVAKVLKQDAVDGILDVNTITNTQLDKTLSLANANVAYLTGQEITPVATTYYEALLEDEGSVASVFESVSVPDNSTVGLGQDHLSEPTLADTTVPSGERTATLTYQIGQAAAQEQFFIEIYLTDNDGVVIDSGTGLPNGDLGFPPIVNLQSIVINTVGTNQFREVSLSGDLGADFTFLTGQRYLVHILCGKVGAAGPSKTVRVYFGTDHNSKVIGLFQITTDTVINVSDVPGTTQTGANNWLLNNTDLQHVTNNGNATDKDIILTLADDTTTITKGSVNFNDVGSGNQSTLSTDNLTYITGGDTTILTPQVHALGTINLLYPAEDGTIALVSEVEERVRWFYPYAAGQYPKNWMTREDDWTMIANKETSDYPAPVPVGDPTWILPNTPVWSLPQYIGNVFTGIVVRPPVGEVYEVATYRIWIAELSNTAYYQTVAYDIVTGVFTFGDTYTGDEFSLVAPDWVEIPVKPRLLGSNDQFVLGVRTWNTAGSTQFNHPWMYMGDEKDDVPLTGEMYRDKDKELRFHRFDDDGVDRIAEFQSIVVGTTIRMAEEGNLDNFREWTINSLPTLVGDVFVFADVDKNSDGGGGSNLGGGGYRCQAYFDIPIPLPATYPELVNHLVPNPSLTGYIAFDEITGGVENETGYGVDIQFQEYEISEDWDIVAVPSEGASAGGNGGGGIGEAPIDGQEYVRKDADWEVLVHPTDNNDFVTTGSFNTATGDITLTVPNQTNPVFNTDGRYSLLGHTHPWSDITGTPTTLAGYGISDTKAGFNSALTDGDFLFVGDANNYTHPAYIPISLTATGAEVISTVSTDSIGSVTGFTKRTMTLADLGFTPQDWLRADVEDYKTNGALVMSDSIGLFVGSDKDASLSYNATSNQVRLNLITANTFDIRDNNQVRAKFDRVTGLFTPLGGIQFNDSVQAIFGTDSDVDFRYSNSGGNFRINLNTANDIQIRDNNTTRFTFSRTTGNFTNTGNIISSGTGNNSFVGNVGIGTASPQADLELLKSNPEFKISHTAGGIADGTLIGQITFTADDNSSGRVRENTAYIRQVGTGTWTGFTAQSNLSFGIRNSATTFIDDAMVLNYQGNLGIGTTSPVSGLHLRTVGNTTFTLEGNGINQVESGRIRFVENSSNFQGGFIHYNGSSNTLNIGVHDSADSLTGSDTNVITLQRANSRVGIGTTNPTEKLDVIGNVALSTGNAFKVAGADTGLYVFNSNVLELKTSNTTRMKIQGGNVIIGSSAGNAPFDVQVEARHGRTISQINATGANSLVTKEYVDSVAGGGGGTPTYMAKVSANGTNNPNVTVLENSLGFTPVWTRTGVGIFQGTFTGGFPVNNTVMFFEPSLGTSNNHTYRNTISANFIQIACFDSSGNPADGIMTLASLQVKVYP